MKRLRDLNLGQRIILIVALAAVLRTIGVYATTGANGRDGWFAYAPNTQVTLVPDRGLDGLPAALLWMTLIVAWALVGVWLLGQPRRED